MKELAAKGAFHDTNMKDVTFAGMSNKAIRKWVDSGEVLFREDLERIYGPRQAEIEEKKQAEAHSDTQELAQSAESDDAYNTTAPKPEEQ